LKNGQLAKAILSASRFLMALRIRSKGLRQKAKQGCGLGTNLFLGFTSANKQSRTSLSLQPQERIMDNPAGESQVSPGFRENLAAPIVYFDASSAHGVLQGAVQIELVSRILVPLTNGGVKIEFSVTGRLRCSPNAARILRDSLDKALGMLSMPQQEPAAEASKMN
jgi:hypothetical protein